MDLELLTIEELVDTLLSRFEGAHFLGWQCRDGKTYRTFRRRKGNYCWLIGELVQELDRLKEADRETSEPVPDDASDD